MVVKHLFMFFTRAILGLVLLLPFSVWAAGPIYVSIEGATQGAISAGASSVESIGGYANEDHVDEITALGFSHSVTIPTDPQSGQPSGARIHQPVSIHKLIDRSSPLLYQALTSGERLTRVVISFYRTSAVGTVEHYYSIVLEDAIIVDIASSSVVTTDVPPREVVSLTYRSIQWVHELSGTAGSDDWRTPVQ